MADGAERQAGSPAGSEPAFLAVGLICRPHGIKGEAFVEVYTDFPERLQPKEVLFAGERHIPLKIRSRRVHKNGLLITFEGIETPEEVGRYRNQILYVTTADRPSLPVGEYYHHQLTGLNVVDENGQELGTLTEILVTGANDVYVVKRPDGGELLIPVIPGVVLDVDLPRRKIRVHLLPGLELEDEV